MERTIIEITSSIGMFSSVTYKDQTLRIEDYICKKGTIL